MYLKAISRAPLHERSVWTVETLRYTRRKFFPSSYEDLQTRFLQGLGTYTTPLPTPCLEEGYDWEDPNKTRVLVFIKALIGEQWENFILSEVVVYVMNDEGRTIDKILA